MKCYAVNTSLHVEAVCSWDLKLVNCSLPIVSTCRVLGVTLSHDLPRKTLSEVVHRRVTPMIDTIHCFDHTLNLNSLEQILLYLLLLI